MPVLQFCRTLLAAPLKWARAETGLVLVWLAGLFAIELLGKISPHEAVDFLLCLGIIGMTWLIHVRQPLKLVGWLLEATSAMISQAEQPGFKLGVDLRETARVPVRLPPAQTRLLISHLIVSMLLLQVGGLFPGGLRELLQPYCMLLYLAFLCATWSAMLIFGLVHLLIAYETIRDEFVFSYRGQGVRPRRREMQAIALLVGLVVIASLILPSWIPFAINLLALGATTGMLMLTSSGLNLLWRADRQTQIFAIDGRVYAWSASTNLMLITLTIIIATQGEVLFAQPAEAEPSRAGLTVGLGLIFGWVAVPGLLAAVYQAGRFAWLGLAFNPQREQQRLLQRNLADLRPWEIEQRRGLIRGLRTLFKRKARVTNRSGTGVWIGLQHWYVVGMSRDDAGEDPESSSMEHVIGPPYHRLFSRETRLHFWQVCRATQVDLILVEDGVTFQRFVRVLRILFEIFDIYGGLQRAEEMHFQGLPGVRVVLHEFELATDETLSLTDYPEPDYDQIASARILHIFKDRGEAEELDNVPFTSDDVPVLAGV